MDTNTFRFQDVSFIEEGSIFGEKVTGNLIQVASKDFLAQFHEVYKNGLGMYISIGGGE